MESLKVFEEVVNLECFKNIPIVIVLTKPDLLEKALKIGLEFKKYFPEFYGLNFLNFELILK